MSVKLLEHLPTNYFMHSSTEINKLYNYISKKNVLNALKN